MSQSLPNRFNNLLEESSTEPASSTQAPTKKNHTILVLDSSGSMLKLKAVALEAVNEQLLAAKRAEGVATKVSLITFGAETRTTFWGVPAAELGQVHTADYMPAGPTAMLDAVQEVIGRLEASPDVEDLDMTFLIIIVSDGAENASRKATYRAVGEKIQLCKATGRWTFTYAGSEQDLAVIRDTLHIDQGNITSWAPTMMGMKGLTQQSIHSTARYYKNITHTGRGCGQSADFYSTGEATVTLEEQVNPDPPNPKSI